MRFRAAWAVILAAALLVALLAYGVASRRPDTSIDEAIAAGERVEAPTARLPVLGRGGEGSLADYRGKVVVLNFWASWCKPCTEELPLLEKTHKAISGRGALVLGANYQDVSDSALGFVRRFGLTYPSLRDRDGEWADRYGSRASGAGQSTSAGSTGRCRRCWGSGREAARRAPRRLRRRAVGGRRHAAPRLAPRRRGRGDVRRVRDRAQRLHLGGRRSGARLHPPPDRAGQGQGADQGGARRRVRPGRAGHAGGEGLQPRRLPRAGRAGAARARGARARGPPVPPAAPGG